MATRSRAAEAADKLLIGTEPPSGAYAEDMHLVSGYVGFGVML